MHGFAKCSAKHKHSREIWGHATTPPRKFLKIHHSEIEFKAISTTSHIDACMF